MCAWWVLRTRPRACRRHDKLPKLRQHRFRARPLGAMDTPPPGPADPSRGWDAGGGAAVSPPSSPALTFAIGMGLMLAVPLLLALTIASCWRRCQKQLTARSREDSCHRSTARWSECREDPSDEDDDDDEPVTTRREEEPVTPRRLLLASSDEEEASPRRQRASRPGRVPRRGTGGRCAASTAEPELTKVFFRSSDWSSRGRQPKMAELSLQGVTSVQELCARLREALGRGALAEGLALSIEYQDSMGEMVQLTQGAEMDVLDGVRSLYVTTNRAKSLLSESTSSKAPSMSRCSSSQPLVAADDDDDLSGCSGVKSTCGGIEVAASAVPRKQSRSERHRFRLTKLKHYFTL